MLKLFVGILLSFLLISLTVSYAESPCKNQSRWYAEMYDETKDETTTYTPEDFFTPNGALISGYLGQSNLVPGYYFQDTTCYTDDFEIEYVVNSMYGWSYIYAGMSITAEPWFDFDDLKAKPVSKRITITEENKDSDPLRASDEIKILGFRFHNDTLLFYRNGVAYQKQEIPICKIEGLFVYWGYGGGSVQSIRLTDYTNNTEYFEDFTDCENMQLFKECEPDPVVELSATYQLPSCEDSSLYLFAHTNILEDFHCIGPDSVEFSNEQNPVIKNGWEAQSGTYIVWGKYHRCAEPVYYKLQIDIPKKEVILDTVSVTMCWGDTLKVGSLPITDSGVYVDSLFSVGGCDSVVTYQVDVRKPIIDTVNLTTCSPDSVLFNEKYYKESGAFLDTIKSVDSGCDSIVYNLIVDINESYFLERYDTLCYGFSMEGHDKTGDYVDSLHTVHGCDSVDVLHLKILPIIERNNGVKHICEGDSVEVNGHWYLGPGTYIDTLYFEDACDTFLVTKVEMDSMFTVPDLSEVKACRLAYLQFDVDSVPGASYSWKPSYFLSDTLVRNPFVTATMNMNYKVYVERGLCRDTAEVKLLVSSGPEIRDVYFDTDYNTVTIHAEGGVPDYLYTWESVGWQDSPTFDTKISIGKKTAKVKDDYGCEDEYNYMLFIPVFPEDHFSPDGDGIKDRWEIKNLEYYNHYEIRIFDRFGKQLVAYFNHYPGWDGVYLGHDMPSTDYWYVISIHESDVQLSGHFTLYRP
ncbi:MAG TPA: T9SS type B sorting domain-containing protein [Paludibacteraceae bacterium]|nr:T9SS type B sorting domain-containing protein [Paludibacteraceae bacterium]HQF49457.1 T9SS type B sorting domain-containing protein [Paludibacteraceae bacterium]